MASAYGDRDVREIRDGPALAEREALLASRGLSVPGSADLVLGLYEGERLAATGSLVGNVIQGLAVSREGEGGGAAAVLVTALLKEAAARGLGRVAVFTKPREAAVFEDLGFRRLATAERPATGLGAALLEWGSPGIGDWKSDLSRGVEGRPRPSGVVVVNCNPFTKGHQALLEWAASESPWVHVLVVEEDRSLFPFPVRLDLVRKGTAHIRNLDVHPGGPYVISSATFPTYFTRPRPGSPDDAVAELHAALDLEVFRAHVAPVLGASERFVGTEPYCPTTSTYNRLMKEILPVHRRDSAPVAVREMPRVEQDGQAVSASRVRDLIRTGRLEEVRSLVPGNTWDWLRSPEAEPVLKRIRASDTRH